MLPLTLKVFMDYGGADDNKFFELHYYVTSVRAKHFTSEAGFLCLLARLLQWIGKRSPTLPSHFAPTDDLLASVIKYLVKVNKEDTGIFTFISSKKTATPKWVHFHYVFIYLFLISECV